MPKPVISSLKFLYSCLLVVYPANRRTRYLQIRCSLIIWIFTKNNYTFILDILRYRRIYTCKIANCIPRYRSCKVWKGWENSKLDRRSVTCLKEPKKNSVKDRCTVELTLNCKSVAGLSHVLLWRHNYTPPPFFF